MSRVVLVTGGTRNIGRGIAEGFLALGDTVLVCGRRQPETLPHTNNAEAHFLPCDVRQHGSISELFATIGERFGRLDVLINNAGGGPPTDAAGVDPQRHETIIQLNLIAPLHCAQAAARLMTKQTGGTIVNIASVGGDRPSPGTAAYGAAKAGLLHLTRSLAMEWGSRRIRVNAIIAGLIATDSAHDHYGGEAGIRRIDAMLPLGRMGTPNDIARACVYLASDEAEYVSGAELAVHGGGEVPVFLHLAKSDANKE